MREKYIQLIKEYFKERPDYQNHLEEIKKNLLLVGVTDEEFNQAIKEISSGFEANNSVRKVLSRKTILLLLMIFPTIIISVIYCSWFFLQPNKFNPKPLTLDKFSREAPTPTQGPLMPKMYTTSNMVNVERTFSYAPKNITLAMSATNPKREVFGFFPYWMLSKADKVNINPITTISLFGLEVDGKGNIVTGDINDRQDGGWAMWNDPNLDNFIRIVKNKRKKIVLTIKSFSNDNIEKLVLSDQAQKNFISNSLHMISVKSLDGLNIDFEYFGTPDPKVRESFSRFITNLYIEMKRQIPNATLTLDTYVHSASASRLFDLEVLSSQSDALIIMGYDFHTPSGSPGPVAPFEGELSIFGFVSTYLEKVPPEKIILALPYYGYDWPVTSDSNNPAFPVSYAEVTESSKNYTISWDKIAQTPYYQYTPAKEVKRIVHFENTRSLGIKYDYINKKKLKGVGIWALGYDGLNNDLEQLLIEKFFK